MVYQNSLPELKGVSYLAWGCGLLAEHLREALGSIPRTTQTNRHFSPAAPFLRTNFPLVLRSRNLRASTFHPFNLPEDKKFLLYALCILPLISCCSEMQKEIYRLSSEIG